MKKSTFAIIPAAGIGIGAGVFTEELYRYIFCRHGWSLLLPDDKGDHSDEYRAERNRLAAELQALPVKEYSITSVRGRELKGFYYQWGEQPSRKKVFIIHGYRSEHLQTAGFFYRQYRDRGIDLFCCDHEAHGASPGHLISYDYYESADCLRWLDFLTQEFGEDIEVFLHGFSMGGGTVLKMSDRVPPCVKFIIDDCGFSSAKEILKPAIGPFYGSMNALSKLIGGFTLEDTDVRPNLKKAHVPILFVHGTLDHTVPYVMGPELFGICPTEKDCLFVEGAKHVECMWKAPERYFRKIDGFIKRYMSR